jgi:hypothetical protein
MSSHLKRNYNFQLSRHVDIDGACSGNESRLINDARPKMSRVNCMAVSEWPIFWAYLISNRVEGRWVAGDPHLAIIAGELRQISEDHPDSLPSARYQSQ